MNVWFIRWVVLLNLNIDARDYFRPVDKVQFHVGLRGLIAILTFI
jgi:hypothetical protein